MIASTKHTGIRLGEGRGVIAFVRIMLDITLAYREDFGHNPGVALTGAHVSCDVDKTNTGMSLTTETRSSRRA